MSAPFVIAVPAKGRLQENADAFFARAGLQARQAARRARLSRHDRGPRPASRSRICRPPKSPRSSRRARCISASPARTWCARCIPTPRRGRADRQARVRRRQCRGRGAAGLDRRAQHGRSRRCRDRVPRHARPQDAGRDQIRQPHARTSSRSHGITDYRIVESLGATEGAPATGTAELIVDITTTGSTLAANGAEGDRRRRDPALAGQPRSRRAAPTGASGSARPRATSSTASPRRRARAPSAKCAPASPAATTRCWRRRSERFGVATPFGGPTSSGMLTLHCPPGQVHALASFLRDKGAEASRSPTSITCSRATIRFMPSSRRGWRDRACGHSRRCVCSSQKGTGHDQRPRS